jgi:hypothetical protein
MPICKSLIILFLLFQSHDFFSDIPSCCSWKFYLFHALHELLCNWQSVRQSVRFDLEPLCNSRPDFSWSETITGLMSWGVFPDGRTGLSSLLDPLLESSSLNPLESSLLDPLLESSSLDPVWNRLCSTHYWSLLHSAVFFARPFTGVFITWPSGVFFTWLSLESCLLDPLLESSNLSQSESF